MKIVEQSFQILPEHHDPVKQIAERSRICYKSEDKAKEDEHDFVSGIIRNGHNSCLEMYMIYLEFTNLSPSQIKSLYKQKFFQVSEIGIITCVSGSIRSFREYLVSSYAEKVLRSCIHHKLMEKYEFFFQDVEDNDIYTIKPILIKEKNPLETDVIRREFSGAKHIHVAVRIITNRAVTHEIVRHRPCSYLQESQRYCRYSEDQFGNEVTFIKPTAFYTEGSEEYDLWKLHMGWSETTYLILLKTSSPQAARLALPNSCKTEIIVYCNLREWKHIFAMRAINKAAEPSMREIMVPLYAEFCKMYPGFEAKVSVG